MCNISRLSSVLQTTVIFCQLRGLLIFLSSFPEWLLKATVSLAMSVCLSASNRANPTALFFIFYFFFPSARSVFHQNRTEITLYMDICQNVCKLCS
jgi:hypothetical protein